MWGIGSRNRYRDPEIAPDEIFLDSSNLPDFNRSQLEGKLEKPISRRTYGIFGAVIALILIALLSQAWNLQVHQGVAYAARSEKNVLAPETLFAARGIITDRNGSPLVTNEASSSSDPAAFANRVYKTPGFGQLLGYVSYPKKDTSGNYYDTDITGVAGVEETFNTQLAGENGTLLVERDALGKAQSEGTIVSPQNGATLTLSIDARAQSAFYSAISSLADRIPFSGGAGIMMDVNTGQVIALVSYPEYDPNILSAGQPRSVIAGYSTDSRTPYLDRPVQGLYTPGSIVKPEEAAGALTDGVVTPNTTVNDIGYITIPNPYDPSHPNKFVDWKAIGVEDLRKAIAYSSDVYFYMVGGGYQGQGGLGIDRLGQWYSTFGLTSETGIQLPGEKSGFVPDPAWKQKTFSEAWNIGDTYHTAIGQYSMQVTPIEMARAIAAIANGGKLVTPTLIKDAPPQGESIAVNPQMLQVVREGMRMGVTEGTSVGLNDMSFVQPAGKTGTAQTGLHNEYYNSWAVGFWPYNAPKYVYVVMMEHGPAGNALGGIYAMHQVFMDLHQSAPEYFE
ncbi:MAG TPA: penicillin-binding transpeptidase domain-containing protein [Candidatus Paceibacterota bacterium]|nr:penicillin-binding transpeptidase domain-containing protein [Candidatus Paceibacterota bacterium]